jgi:hypothetical protein
MAIPDEIPQGSQEFLVIDFTSADDLTTATVKIGVTTDPVDQPATWMNAVWPTPAVNQARTTTVWDTTSVTPGYYAVWSWVQDSPESLPRRYGVVRVV